MLANSASAQTTYFPNNAFGKNARRNQFTADWYGHALKMMQEPSLLESGKDSGESYRFLLLRTFHSPLSVRLQVQQDGSGIIVTKIATGSAGFPYTIKGIQADSSQPVSREQVKAFLALVEKLRFWSIPSFVEHDQTGTDGSGWIIEAVKDGNYHVASRWSPCDTAGPGKREVRELGLALAFDLAKLKTSKKEIY